MQTDPQKAALLNLSLRLATTPALSVIEASGIAQPAPDLDANASNGFALELEATVSYNALNQVLHTFLQGKRVALTEGLINQHVVIEGCKLDSTGNNVVAEIPFSGSFDGIFYLTGTPIYNPQSRCIELQDVAYDLKTKSLLLKGIKWVFGKLILEEIKKYTTVDVTKFYSTATERINQVLNKEWTRGIQATGNIDSIVISGVYAQPQQLVVRAYCSGSLKLSVSELVFNF